MLSRGIWRLRNVFFLPTVIRPAESRKHKELCFGSGQHLLLRHRDRAAEGGGRGRDWGAKREGQERTSASSASSVQLISLHPSLHPAPPLFYPAAGQFSPQQRKKSLMAQTETSVCVRTKKRVSKLSMNLHPLSPLSRLSFPHSFPPSLLLTPFYFPWLSSFILHGLFLIQLSFPLSFSYSSCHSHLWSLWTSLPVQF
ncbi:hypothetical protein PBY51_011542 [Eleginops maclovinus]|uniref:Uncharacterized protein n=1 Tax=Eleginops maclovinus TaxID=56733 RepID=A0AAN7XNW8_ELEMC|nr:hypothetical protein PBY51_011542 [Eleginops maclovinus]